MSLNLSDIEKAIVMLQKIEPSDGSAYGKAKAVLRGIPILPVFICDVPKRTALFRSRTRHSSDVFTQVSEITEPPPSGILNFGRCNKPSQPRFYCSSNRPTSYVELVKQWLDSVSSGEKVYVTIGRWELKKPMPTAVVARRSSNNESSDYDRKNGPHLDFFLADLEPEEARAAEEFFTFMAKKFRQPRNPKTYALCTAYSNILFEQTEADAIAYPSVPFGEQGLNYCMEASFRHSSNLDLTNVLQNELTATVGPEGTYSFDETDSKIASRIDMDQGEISW